MRTKVRTRVGSIFIALCMLLCLLPVSAFASGENEMTGEAFLATADEGVITLTEDTVLTSTAAISSGAYTVNLGGCTLSGNGNFIFFDLSGDASLTINGPGTVSGRRTASSGKNVFKTAGSAALTLQGTESGRLTIYGDTAGANTISASGSGSVTAQYVDIYSGDTPGRWGGSAVFNWQSSGDLSVNHTTITGYSSTASNVEGSEAIEIKNGRVTLQDSEFRGGNSKFYNAASAIKVGAVQSLSIDGCTIQGGNVTDASPNYGQGGHALEANSIYSGNRSISITDSTLTGGNGGYSDSGCGVYLDSEHTSLSVDNSTIKGAENGFDENDDYGNALYIRDTPDSVSLSNVTLWADIDRAKGYDGLGYVVFAWSNIIDINASGTLSIDGGALSNVNINSADDSAPVNIETKNDGVVLYNGTVTVDNVPYAPFELHRADETVEYFNEWFSDAVEAAQDGDTIVIRGEKEFGSSVTIDKDITVAGMDKLDVGYYALTVFAGRYDQDPTSYLGVGCQAAYDEVTGLWTVSKDTAAQLTATYQEPENGSAIITVAGDLANGTGTGVTRENGAITIDFAKGEPYVYSMDVTLSGDALRSIAQGLAEGEVVNLFTDAGKLTFDKAAWSSMAANAGSGNVYLQIGNGSSYNELTAQNSNGDTVFAPDDTRSGSVIVTMPCRKTVPGTYESVKMYAYNQAATYLDGLDVELDSAANTLTWTVDCFTAYNPVFFTGTEEAVAQKPSTSGYYTLQATTLEEILKFDNWTTTKTVQLVKDVSDAELTIPEGKTVTLDLNGKTLDCAEPIQVDGTLILKNGTVSGLDSGLIATGATGAVTVENCTFKNSSGETVEDVIIPDAGQIIVKAESDGTTLKMETIQTGGSFTLPGAPVKDGCTFTAWSDGETTYAAGATVDNITAATVFTARWSLNPTSVTLNQTNVTLYSNTTPNTVTLTAAVAPEGAADAITWTSSNSAVATVADGVVTATGNGTAIITATAQGGASATCTVTVTTYTPSSGGGSSSSGNKTETVTNPDGSTTTTVTRPDGSTTVTTKNPDGSTEVVDTKKDGTVTTTTTDKTGNKTETVEKPDGTSRTTITNKDGSSSTTTVNKDGQVETQVKLPADLVADAADKDEAVSLPMPEVSATTDETTAPTVTVDLPSGTTAKVEIPVENVTPGTVAILVKDDGTEEIVKNSVVTENGLTLTVADGAKVRIVDRSIDFIDVRDGYWAEDEIDFVSSRELFTGTSANTFSPEVPMTRAMLMTVLARYEGVDTTTGSQWYEAGVKWAMENGISDGTNLDASVTREQLATMLYRYVGEPEVTGTLNGFADAGSVSDWAKEGLTWAVENGLINGMGDGSLNPQGTANRAQVAAILARFAAMAH